MRNLYIFLAHIDDFECSCYGYLFKHHKEYKKINLIVTTNWEQKKSIMLQNLKDLPNSIGTKLEYKNLNFEQRTLVTEFDNVKDKFYKEINFDNHFDILTHDENDTHTDHKVISDIAKGMFKYSQRFISVYSPSSINFNPNYFIGLHDTNYEIKKSALDKYNIENEQSYSKLGYYLQSEEHYNIGRAHVLENYVFDDYEHYEIYKILKWL